MKVNEAGTEVRKDVLETEAQQKLLRGLLEGEFETAKKDLRREMQTIVDSAKSDKEK